MTRWQEVDSEIFKKIFNYYWEDKPDTVLELQNMTESEEDIRAFLGDIQYLNPLLWKSWNEESLKSIINQLNMRAEDYLKLCKLGFCLLEGGPRIAPFGSTPTHYDILLTDIFDYPGGKNLMKKHLYFWYSYDESGNIIKPTLPPSPTRIYRVRTYQANEWRSVIDRYINDGCVFPEELTKDDIKIH